MLTLTCEKCQKRYKIDPRLAGKTLKCKVCGHAFVVPAGEPLESEGLLAELPLAAPAEANARAVAPPPLPSKAKSSSRAKAPAAPTCPQCAAALAPEAKLCVSCGYSLVTGKKLKTTLAREPQTLQRVNTSGLAMRAGRRLVTTDATVLPERCVCCNSENGVQMKNKTFSYIPYWAIFLTGYLIGYFLFRRTSSMTYGMCANHNRTRTIMSLVAAAALVGAIGLIYLAINAANNDGNRDLYLFSGLIGFPVAVIIALMIPGPKIAYIDGGGQAQYRGCSKKFLESL